VRTALSPPAAAPQPSGMQPAAAPGSTGIMVQVAAISRVDDARVLADALQKRGYAVVARREPTDSLIHILLGPFATRADAEAMIQKLVGDGYSGTIVP
jgi:DedD protein